MMYATEHQNFFDQSAPVSLCKGMGNIRKHQGGIKRLGYVVTKRVYNLHNDAKRYGQENVEENSFTKEVDRRNRCRLQHVLHQLF